MKTIFSIEEMKEIVATVLKRKEKIIYVAWASASWKSYFAKVLKESLEKKGHKVLALSSDNYYVDNTRLKHLIYGTFDHPKLIRYDQLSRDIKHYLANKSIKIPQYSFIESKRIGYDEFTWEVDYIIVEWLYTINSLPSSKKNKTTLSFFVDSPIEELIIRRLVRDQERTQQWIDSIISDISKVFPMWNIYGKNQRAKADYIINNDFEILDTKWEQHIYEITNLPKNKLWKLISKKYYTDYEYNDSKDNNGLIIISEVYKSSTGDLDSVVIAKHKAFDEKESSDYKIISINSAQLWIITQLHTLVQLAWLQLKQIVNKTISTYEKNGKIYILKERKWKKYIDSITS